jgi:transglutaminase-like putative cysteine protease
MRIRAGFTITYDCPVDTPLLLMLSVHPSRRDDLEGPEWISTDPNVEVHQYLDGFGNIVSRITAPAGQTTLSSNFVVRDSGLPDEQAPHAIQHRIEDLPDDALVFLLGSRYCETDRMSQIAWDKFGLVEPGWARVQAIIDFVHNHLKFDYMRARPTRSALEAYEEGTGVCRDFAHLAVTLTRCMNIPARYCMGYLGDIGVPEVNPMDFHAWFEVYLGGRWYAFDARNHKPRIGRVMMAYGRDAGDVPLTHIFGPAYLARFDVVAKEIVEA